MLSSAEWWLDERIYEEAKVHGLGRAPLDDFKARFTLAWYRNQLGDASLDEANGILGRSLVFWPRQSLVSRLISPEDLAQSLARASGRLLRARDVLDQAESFLVGARRIPEWWSCLYQLRAKLQVERMLLLLTNDQLPTPSFLSYGGETDLESRRKRFNIAQFTALLQEGLHAVRQGLDLVLPTSAKDRRVRRFLRTWVELAICGALLTKLTGDAGENTRPEKLLENWTEMNRRARIFRLPKSELMRHLNENLGGPEKPGVEARVFMMTTVHEALHGGILDELPPFQAPSQV
jgi:hypothetical protein